MVIPGEALLAMSLALFAIVCIIFWRFGITAVPEDEWARGFRWPLQPPRRVQVWVVIALVLLIASTVLFCLAMPRLRQYGLWGFF
jgi:hypothetical protein